VRFATELKEPAFTPREVLAGKDAPTLARDLLAICSRWSRRSSARPFASPRWSAREVRGLQGNARMTLECADEVW